MGDAAALVLHGVYTVVSAIRSGGDRRLAGLLSGTATIVIGLFCITWPVLAIQAVRYAVGAWLVFFGLRGLVDLALRSRRARRGHPDAAPRRGPGRGRIPTLASAAALVVALALVAGSVYLLRGDGRPAPDAFYTPETPLPTEPGVLLRAETLTEGVPDGADGWRILYTTTRPDDSITVASGTVVAPEDRSCEAGDPIDYRTYPGLDHLSLVAGSSPIIPQLVEWTLARWDGADPTPTC